MFPVFTASASLVPQPLYADSYYDSFQPDREERRHYGELEDYDTADLEDELERRRLQQQKKDDEPSWFITILEIIGILILVFIACCIGSSSNKY